MEGNGARLLKAILNLKLSPLKADTQKYQQGKVLILAGSVGMTGAAYLSTMGALRSGVGLTMTCAPSSLKIYTSKKLLKE
ncbi:MAG: hypothetical protein CM1200mP1_08970 [Candidatus Neomarinimicrobiota bacterium]|nr:MAG: hypothetical protein CM1200mP1_08970 [Candidatus Neomarinimicrobiota bacterium]